MTREGNHRVPIQPELRHFYGVEWCEVIRPRILKRARYKCEQCGKPDRTRVWVYRAGECPPVRAGHNARKARGALAPALCQWCHLNLDKLHHKESRQARKDRARPMLEVVYVNTPP